MMMEDVNLSFGINLRLSKTVSKKVSNLYVVNKSNNQGTNRFWIDSEVRNVDIDIVCV